MRLARSLVKSLRDDNAGALPPGYRTLALTLLGHCLRVYCGVAAHGGLPQPDAAASSPLVARLRSAQRTQAAPARLFS